MPKTKLFSNKIFFEFKNSVSLAFISLPIILLRLERSEIG